MSLMVFDFIDNAERSIIIQVVEALYFIHCVKKAG